ncbi:MULTISPECIES: aspartate-alanine antiporter-like transporter [Proteiniphilum]|jgi:uncharacterized transporter YbjL|uniref:aspartate-alanine antiporter-like transporter n=1 Tax=Proteiniphilum TaxID=294702 RepID=UPI001EEBD405|nr:MULTISPECIES: hypothetical protein [Proteiniphilum]ULB33818.1 hypothetical protein KDN43_12595 [Proteiniphilum propionicum]
MEWFHSLLFEDGIAHTVLLYALTISAGVALGKIRIFGISLGVTFVLITAGAAAEAVTAFLGETTELDWKELDKVLISHRIVVTTVPLLLTECVARKMLHLDYFTLTGLLSGSMTDPPALAYSNSIAGNDPPAVAYSTVYPLTMFLWVISAQILILILMFL